MPRHPFIPALCVLSFLSTSFAVGDEPAKPNASEAPPVVSITVSPADEPSPPLRYSFVTPYLDQTDGNAATFYYRAITLLRTKPEPLQKDLLSKPNDWFGIPVDQLPKDEVGKLLRSAGSILGELRTASRCETCRWDFRMRDRRGRDVPSVLLPEMQELRTFAKLIAVEARLAIAEGRFDDAVDSLRVGYRLAQDAGREPILICGLVGIACAAVMQQQTLDLMQQPQAPNLYWALSTLPEPLVDLRRAKSYEMSFAFQMFPVLRDAETAERTQEQWDAALAALARELGDLLGLIESEPSGEKATSESLLKRAQSRLPEVRKRLVARGRAEAEVKAMPDGQALLIDAAQNLRQLNHELFKEAFLPPPLAFHRARAVEQRLKGDGWLGPNSKEPMPIASTLLSAVPGVTRSEALLAHRLAQLRVVEAVRMHAARHGGKLPGSLAEITAAPPPDDPLTGRPFVYRRDGDAALIETVVLPGDDPKAYKTLRLTVRVTVRSR